MASPHRESQNHINLQNVYIQQVTLDSTAMEERGGWETLTALHGCQRSEEEERGGQ
jgi:hypothetical protein